MKRVTVLLADDHALLRSGIRSLLSHIDWIEVVGEAQDGREAVSMAHAKRPDIVLMDISMSGLNGLEATARIIKDCGGVQVIILSMHSQDEYVLQALRAGASGYLLKDAASPELEYALKAVASGQRYLGPAISKSVIDQCLSQLAEQDKPINRLTTRQREILQLIAEGNSTKEIAYSLNVSVKTIEAHRSHLMERLGIRDVAGLVRFAVRSGIISADK